jgi:hypothetical protein
MSIRLAMTDGKAAEKQHGDTPEVPELRSVPVPVLSASSTRDPKSFALAWLTGISVHEALKT